MGIEDIEQSKRKENKREYRRHLASKKKMAGIKVRISNTRHLGELQIVFAMLEGQGLRPINETQTAITVLAPDEAWFKSLKRAIEFMTSCGVEKA